jgi:hypothetical protein
LLGRLASMGYGPDRIVPIAFHVDYFNDPWKDRFSDVAYSRREMAYNEALGRKDLYFTPMMMVDGRYPMLGSDRPKAEAAIGRASEEPPGVALEVALEGSAEGPGRRSLRATVADPSRDVAGRELLVGVAIFEDPVSTDVPAGENAGKTLVEHFAVRKFTYRRGRLGRGESKTLTFPLELGPGWDARRCGVAVFVQDWKAGRVYQADSLPWADRPSP